MANQRTGTRPNEDDAAPGDHDASWTNETLPLGIRRELLDRELQKLMARKRQGTASAGSQPGHSAESASGHPMAGAPPGDERAS